MVDAQVAKVRLAAERESAPGGAPWAGGGRARREGERWRAVALGSATAEQLGPEEKALQTTYLGSTMSEILEPAEAELAEMQEAGVQSDERIEAQREEDSLRAETEVVIVEEEELSEASSSQWQPWLWRRRRRSVAGRGSR